jgi:hypothetical protein
MSHCLEMVLQITIKSINLQPVVTLFCFFGQLFSNVTAKRARLSFLNFVSSSLGWGDPGMEFVRGDRRSRSKTLKKRSQSLNQHERIRSRSPIKPSKSSRRFHSSKRVLGGNKSVQLYAIAVKGVLSWS